MCVIAKTMGWWVNEVKQPEDLLSKAITQCIEIDKQSGILKRNSDGLD